MVNDKDILWSSPMPLTSFIWKVIRKLASFNYYSAKALYKYKLDQTHKLFNGPPLLIYQMGKVGSSSIKRSLEDMDLDMPIYHTHGLSDYYIKMREEQSRKYFRSERGQTSGTAIPWESEFIRDIFQRGNGRKCKVITLVRDPMARKVSSFFQRIHKAEIADNGSAFKLISLKDGYEFAGRMDDMQGLAKLFVDSSMQDIQNDDQVLNFFDREFKDILGIDIYATNFPKSQGFKIYNEQLADVLLIRLEDLNHCCQTAFNEFLGIEGFALLKSNIGGEKAYAPVYHAFKKLAVLPDWFMEIMYGSKFAMHFYSKEEIEKFKAGWQSGRN